MYRHFKRLCDLIFGVFLLLSFFPVLILIGLISILVLSESPLFFQERIGQNERVFKILKFKTFPSKAIKTSSSKWLTFLRKSSLDELPQLINIIKGDMSFIGPRPLLTEYLELYDTRQRLRHRVKPGLSGLVQVSGGNSLEWKPRFELDVKYVQEVSFSLDFKILMRTILVVFKNSSKKKHVSEPFTGNHME